MLAPSAYDARSVAQSRVRVADYFLGEITERLKAIDTKCFESQELRAACAMLRTVREDALRVLQKTPTRPLSPELEKRRLRNEALEATQFSSKIVWIERLRAMGDFRQMKIHLLSTLQLRQQIERESAV